MSDSLHDTRSNETGDRGGSAERKGEHVYNWIVKEPADQVGDGIRDTGYRYDWEETWRKQREYVMDWIKKESARKGLDWREQMKIHIEQTRKKQPNYGKAWWHPRYLK